MELLGWAGFIVAFGIVTVMQIRFVSRTWVISPDSTDYVQGARSIAQGRGYVDLAGQPITLFPPGTSLLYSCAASFQRNDFLFFNILTRILLLAYLVLSFLFLKRSEGTALALIGFLILSFSIVPLMESTRVLSDIPFALSVVLVLYLFGTERLQKLSTLDALLLGFLVTVTCCIRTAGIFVFAAYFVYILIAVNENRNKLLAAFSCVLLAGVLMWSFRNAPYKGYSYSVLFQKIPWVSDSGAPTASDWQLRLLRNGYGQIESIGRAFSNQYKTFWFGLFFCCLAGIGLFVKQWKQKLLFFALLLFYIPVHLVVAAWADRFLISIMPVLMLLYGAAFRAFIAIFKNRIVRVLICCGFVLLLIFSPYWRNGYRLGRNLKRLSKGANSRFVALIFNQDFQKIIEDYNGSLTSTDIVACLHPNVLHYLVRSNVPLVNFLLSTDPQKSYVRLRSDHVTYLYVDQKSTDLLYMQPVLDRYSSEFTVVSSNKGGAIYKLK